MLLLILALLAVIAGAIAASSSSFTSDTSIERAATNAETLVHYGINLRNTVSRLLAVGCDESQISFDAPNYSAVNSNAPVDKHCHVFDVAGGGMLYAEPPSNLGYVAPGFDITGATMFTQVGTVAPDLALELTITDRVVCDRINRMNGNDTTGTTLVRDTKTGVFTGTYTSGNPFPDDGGGDGTPFYGKLGGCVEDKDNSAQFIFYSILSVR